MPAAWEGIDRNFVSAQPDTTVRDLLEGARRKEGRIYTWVVVPLPEGRYAVTRINEIAFVARELGATILDRTLEELGLLRSGRAVQASTDQGTAEMQALTSPGKRIPVLEGEELLGVLNLGPQRPPLPGVDPWRLEDVTPSEWPYDTLKLHHNFAILDPWRDTDELLWWLGQAARGWLYLIVRQDAGFYRVMAVDKALALALEQYGPRYGINRVGDLPLPDPVPAVEENSVAWDIVRGQVLDTPAHCLPITRGGRVIGVLAKPTRRATTRSEWKRALGGEPAPWSGSYEEMLGPPPTAGIEPPDEPAPPSGRPSFRPRPRRGLRPQPPPPSPPAPQPVPGLEDEIEPPPPRFLNVGFFAADQETMQPTDRPLALDGGPYCLGVNAGSYWGICERLEDRFAIDGIMEPQLEELDEGEALALIAVVRPRAVRSNLVRVVGETRKELLLPKRGDGNKVFFELEFQTQGLHALNIDLFYQGHLLQSMRVEVWLVAHAGDVMPDEELPQRCRLTFSRAGTLSKENLEAIKNRPSTLTILADEQSGRLVLWFYDVDSRLMDTRDIVLGEKKRERLGPLPSGPGELALQSLLEQMRKVLEAVEKSYKGAIGGDDEKLRTSLWQLADQGSAFYDALMPGIADPEAHGAAGELDRLTLKPGQVIQVAPLSNLPGVPWELLYDRLIEPFDKGDPDAVRLCPDFREHLLDPCPNEDDPKVVCPYGFWGYRFIIEQLPNRVKPEDPPPLANLPILIRNDRPLRFVPVVYGWENLQAHLDALRALADAGDMQVVDPPVTTKLGLEQVLKEQADPADILYFYAHGEFVGTMPALKLGLEGSEFSFTARNLRAWRGGMDLSLSQPLVVLNACQTAAYLPENYASLPEGFADRGASGVIGTQVKVHESFAAHFIQLFFQRFLRKMTVGQALFEARRELLLNVVESDGAKEYRPDPRGLVYSLFGAADVELAWKVPVRE